jgi:hypothetical protein
MDTVLCLIPGNVTCLPLLLRVSGPTSLLQLEDSPHYLCPLRLPAQREPLAVLAEVKLPSTFKKL